MSRTLVTAARLSLTLALSIPFIAAPASAAPSQRTFVASYGLDSNPNCSLAAPCRSFNAAIAQTNPGGEVVILDTAGYGPMLITKALKVIGPSGVYGGISVIGGAAAVSGIVIDAGVNDDITLRGLDVSGVPGVAGPFPLYGVDIQNAGAVHIEKSSISNFNQDTSACVNVDVTSTVRVFIDDSFLRACRVGLSANASGAGVLANRPSVALDNTRIERGRAPTGIPAYGVWLQGFMDVSIRNSFISRQDVGVQIENLLGGQSSHLELIGSELVRNTTGMQVINTTNGSPEITITKSQILQSVDLMKVSNTAVGGNTWIKISDSSIGYTSTSGLSFANSAADVNTRMGIELIRSSIANITGNAIDLDATNGCQIQFDMRDSTISGAASGIHTTGTGSPLNVSVIRSTITHTTTAIDHGQGTVQLDSAHVNYNNNDFVNSGSPSIVSNGYNMVYNNINAPGPTFITPTVIPLK